MKIEKLIVFGQEAREKLLKGINVVADAVGSTLGPRGRNVAVDVASNYDVAPNIIHDGVSVAKAINLPDPLEDMGVRLLKSAALKTNEKAGDGTTTATILAREIISEAFKQIGSGSNPMELKGEIEAYLGIVTDHLKTLKKKV